jgi:hypothetical protein
VRCGSWKFDLRDLQKFISTWQNLKVRNQIAWAKTNSGIRFNVSQAVPGLRALSSKATVWAERVSVKSLATVTVDGDCGVLYRDSFACNPQLNTAHAKKRRADLNAYVAAI